MSQDVRFARVIDARPDAVFAAFTEQDGQDAFYDTDDPGWIVESECDLRVGGVWTVTFGPSRDELHRHDHVFRVIDRPGRLVVDTTESRADGSSLEFETEFIFDEHDGNVASRPPSFEVLEGRSFADIAAELGVRPLAQGRQEVEYSPGDKRRQQRGA